MGKRWAALGIAGVAVAVVLLMALPMPAQGATSSGFVANVAARAAPQLSSSCHSTEEFYWMYQSHGGMGLEAPWQCSFQWDGLGGPSQAASPKILYFFNHRRAQEEVSTICITDEGWVGDYYGLYLWYPSDDRYHLVGHTPQVYTGSEIVASGYNAYWTGTGSTYSSGCWTFEMVYGEAQYFGIADLFELAIAHSLKGPCALTALELERGGCTATGISVDPGLSPAGFAVSWNTYYYAT